MKLVVVTGFPGSGKTTLLLSLVRRLAAKGAGKILIVENEVGEIGIDNQYLKLEGLKVRESHYVENSLQACGKRASRLTS